jgi:hypothetical protein
MESTSKQLGKALNDPIKGITALNKSGVTFTEEQKKRIKNYVEEGDLLSAQKIILGEVNDQVGGSAEAQGSNLDKLKVQWGNIEEAIGKGVFPAVDSVSASLLNVAKDVLPSVEAAAGRVAGIFGSENLDLGEKFRFSGRAIGEELGPALDPIIASLERELGQIDAGKALGDAIRAGAPVAADAMAAQVPNMARAFVDAFRNAGTGGQLLTVGLLAAKFGAFRGAGAAAAGMFTSSFRTSATTSGVFGSVARSGGSTLGNGLVVHGANGVERGAAAGKFDKAGQAMGRALGVAGGAYAAYEIGNIIRDKLDAASKEDGIEGFLGSLGGAVDDVTTGGGNLLKFGPLAPAIAAVEDSKRRLDGIGGEPREIRPVNIPSPIGDGQRNGSIGRGADVTSRSAGFALPSVALESVTEIAPVILDGEKVGEVVVKRTARRAARK